MAGFATRDRVRVLILGGTGFLGSLWDDEGSGFEILRGANRRGESIEPKAKNVLYLDYLNINEMIECIEKCEIDWIVNLVALTDVDRCEADPNYAYMLNATVAKNIATVARTLGCYLVMFSTDQVFDGTLTCYTEISATNPINVYGKTKLAGENFTQEIHAETIIIRTNFFGYGFGRRPSFVNRLISSLTAGKVVSGWCNVFFTPIYVPFLVRATEKLMGLEKFETFNVAGPRRLSKYEFAIEVARSLDLDPLLIRKSKYSQNELPAKRPLDMSLGGQKMFEIMGANFPDLPEQLALMRHEFGFTNAKGIS